MKQSVFDVLMYLFENYIDDDNAKQTDPEELKSLLKDAGFGKTNISKAFDWLEGLVQLQDQTPLLANSIDTTRIYHANESKKLSIECQGFLHFLEQMGVIDVTNREHIIDRAMALECDEIELTQLKWVVLMVLFNQSGVDEAYVWMENMVLENLSKDFH
jgi:Smg protein